MLQSEESRAKVKMKVRTAHRAHDAMAEEHGLLGQGSRRLKQLIDRISPTWPATHYSDYTTKYILGQ